MKKNVLIIMFAFCATIFLDACSKNKDKEVTQYITGAGDCIHCDGWSWSNGEASTTRNYGDSNNSFSFKTTVTGELTFSHKNLLYSRDSYALLCVSIEDKIYFQNDAESSSFTSSSIGSVKAGEIITFSGTRYSVKGIQIVGMQGETNTDGDSTNPQWDF